MIHVSVSSGSDSGDGSATSPYKTISTALTKASDGDTIELAEGVYQEGELMVTKSVTITAASGAKPVISGAKSPDTWKDAGSCSVTRPTSASSVAPSGKSADSIIQKIGRAHV